MKDRGQKNSKRYKWNKGVGGRNSERWRGGDIEGETDGGVRGRLGYLQITSPCDRFLWRLNWACGLRGNQSKS